MNTLQQIQSLISEELDLPIAQLQPMRPLEELGVDSLSLIEFMFKLEDRFGITMPDERTPIRTLQDIADLVDRLSPAALPQAS